MNHYKNPEHDTGVNWGMLMGTREGTKVYPTDIDGMLEHNGNFLFLEFKHESVKHEDTQFGQRLALERLNALPGVTVVYVYGDYETFRVTGWHRIGMPRVDGNNEQFVEAMRTWWRNTSRKT